MGCIGLWGAPGSGKTTYLSALNIAVMKTPGMALAGADGASTAFLKENTARLTMDREFPEATRFGQQLSWVLDVDRPVKARRGLFGRVTTTVPVRFNLDLIDEPGDWFGDRPSGGLPVTAPGPAFPEGEADGGAPGSDAFVAGLMDQLANCNGILLLLDPTREWLRADAFNFFQGTMLEIAQRRLPGISATGRLPHYVAVCVTKFDHANVYERAKSQGYRSFSPTDPHLFPRIPDEFAEQFFVDLVRATDMGNADALPSALRSFFMPDRVRFFVTSSIGFYLSRRASRFQESDFRNTIAGDTGRLQIRGPVNPINVVEPLLWVCQNFTRS